MRSPRTARRSGSSPSGPTAHSNLGIALREKGKVDDAIAAYREAIRLKPEWATAHYNLGIELYSKGEVDAAVAALREAIRLEPDYANAHYNLGVALGKKGEVDAAIAAYREATRLQPDDAVFQHNLGVTLGLRGEVDAAVAALRDAIRLKPDYANAHYNLGNELDSKGEVDAAVAAYREAIRLKPEWAEAQCNLGLSLMNQAKFAEALPLILRGHELGSKRSDWRDPSKQWVDECRVLIAMDARLPAILQGKDQPKDVGERLTLADLCYKKGLQATSVRFREEAFAEQPALLDDLAKGQRNDAAYVASLAGSGSGKDDPAPDEEARAKFRDKALGWLKADLAAWGKVLDGGDDPAKKSLVAKKLAHWKGDSDLAGVRDAAGLAKLPEGEREAFRALWVEVEAVRRRAAGEGK